MPRSNEEYQREEQIRELIVSQFGDWEQVSSDEDGINVIWDLSDEGLGIHYGWVNIDSEGCYGDWGIEHSHNDAKRIVYIRDWNEYETIVYLHPSGEWKSDRHYYTPTRARTLKNKYGGECLYFWQD